MLLIIPITEYLWKVPNGEDIVFRSKTFADVKRLLLDYAAKNKYAAQLYNLTPETINQLFAVYNTEIRIENASQHDIEIIVEKPSSEFLTGSVALKSGTTFTTKHSIDGGYGLPNPVDAQIKFDDGTTITHHSEDGDTYHNFCSATAFEKKMQGKRSVEYIFVFTDEDYEYAKKHADKTKI